MAHPTWNIPPPVDGKVRVHFRWTDPVYWKMRKQIDRLKAKL